MTTSDSIRAAWAADSRFQSLLERKHGKKAGEVRYLPRLWDEELSAAWAEVQKLIPAMQTAARRLLVAP